MRCLTSYRLLGKLLSKEWFALNLNWAALKDCRTQKLRYGNRVSIAKSRIF
jgi:hypothetical protein